MTTIDWEKRAKERRLENKMLKKKIKEVTISRESWKAKYMEQKEILTDINKKVDAIKKNLNQMLNL